MVTEQEIQKHLAQVNAAYRFRAEAVKMGQKEYNKATWMYAEEANWFFVNNIEYWHDQETGQIRLATAEEKAMLGKS